MSQQRLDRIVTLRVVQPLRRVTRNVSRQRIPILMYHSISRFLSGRHPYYETSTTPEIFALHMRYLYTHGYKTVTLDGAINALTARVDRQVAVTFDDGFADFRTFAMPVLQTYGFVATMFVASGLVGRRESHLGTKKVMTWGELKEVQSAGIEIGSHTVSHPRLQSLTQEEVKLEVQTSKATIEDRLAKAVTTFSYPYAFPEGDSAFVNSFKDCLRSSGYSAGVTTVVGTADQNSDRYLLPRLPVNLHDDLRFFQAKLEGAYDWLHIPQAAYKHLRRLCGPSQSSAASPRFSA